MDKRVPLFCRSTASRHKVRGFLCLFASTFMSLPACFLSLRRGLGVSRLSSVCAVSRMGVGRRHQVRVQDSKDRQDLWLYSSEWQDIKTSSHGSRKFVQCQEWASGEDLKHSCKTLGKRSWEGGMSGYGNAHHRYSLSSCHSNL